MNNPTRTIYNLINFSILIFIYAFKMLYYMSILHLVTKVHKYNFQIQKRHCAFAQINICTKL